MLFRFYFNKQVLITWEVLKQIDYLWKAINQETITKHLYNLLTIITDEKIYTELIQNFHKNIFI